jgi:hypothetical protein
LNAGDRALLHPRNAGRGGDPVHRGRGSGVADISKIEGQTVTLT